MLQNRKRVASLQVKIAPKLLQHDRGKIIVLVTRVALNRSSL
jgi:hypothetical protein